MFQLGSLSRCRNTVDFPESSCRLHFPTRLPKGAFRWGSFWCCLELSRSVQSQTACRSDYPIDRPMDKSQPDRPLWRQMMQRKQKIQQEFVLACVGAFLPNAAVSNPVLRQPGAMRWRHRRNGYGVWDSFGQCARAAGFHASLPAGFATAVWPVGPRKHSLLVSNAWPQRKAFELLASTRLQA